VRVRECVCVCAYACVCVRSVTWTRVLMHVATIGYGRVLGHTHTYSYYVCNQC
jgi:hypothetical protein